MRPPSLLFVTDTHPFLWYAAGNISELGSLARACFDKAEIGAASIVIPSVVMAEAAFIAEKGRVQVKFEQLLEKLEDARNYSVYPLDLTIVRKASELKKIGEIHDRI